MTFTFDKEKVEAAGYTMESVYKAMKQAFSNRNLECISEEEELAFSGTGHNNDYGNMSMLMRNLTLEDWFMDIVKSWFFECGSTREDVLSAVRDKIAKGELIWLTNKNKKVANA